MKGDRKEYDYWSLRPDEEDLVVVVWILVQHEWTLDFPSPSLARRGTGPERRDGVVREVWKMGIVLSWE